MNIKRKRLELLEKRPGSLYDDDPRVIYVKMVRRAKYFPSESKAAKTCTMRTKFNNLLNELVAEEKHYIMGIESCSTEDCFDSFGKLSTKGKYHYWTEMTELLEKFDKKKIKLLLMVHHHDRKAVPKHRQTSYSKY